MTLSKHHIRNLAAGALAFGLTALATAAAAAPFDGFNEHFNLGRSAATGAVCEAKRSFEDPLVRSGARVWNVTCRGWSQRLGAIYVFKGLQAGRLASSWRTALDGRADCEASAAATRGVGGALKCSTKSDKLDYVAFTAPGSAAEGRAAIADLLASGLRYVSGRTPEPDAIAEQSSDVALVAGSHVVALGVDSTRSTSLESRFQEAYARGQDWQFGVAETSFGDLATTTVSNGAGDRHAEALYNLALNVSNKGRFAEADGYFRQADALAASNGSPELADVALNYKAAHARNEGRYEDAIYYALTAYKDRLSGQKAAVVRDDTGAVDITEVGGRDAVAHVTPAEREQVRQAQALEIYATSLEALGRADEARKALTMADYILVQPLTLTQVGAPVQPLADASPWLATRVEADRLRMSRGTDEAADAIRRFRQSVDAFGRKFPGSLPLAGFLVELAGAEASLAQAPGAAPNLAMEDTALSDYEAGFEIFRAQRGSIEQSADLVRPYFDILLSRIEKSPTTDSDYAARFFTASQTLITQSSAEAAKRQAARTQAGDQKAAALDRALESTGRALDVNTAAIRDLQQRGVYQGDEKLRLDAQRASLEHDSQTLEDQLLQADPHFTSALSKVVKLSALQKQLRPGEVYAKVFVLAGRGYGVLVSQDSATPYAIDLTRKEAQDMVEALRKPIDHPRLLDDGRKSPGRFDVALSHRLFQKLFGPVQGKVLAASHIIYEPDANLIGAPIAALAVDDASVDAMAANLERARHSTQVLNYAGVNWLGAHASTSTALSPSAFVQARLADNSKATHAFMGFGDPVISQDPRAFADVRAPGFGAASARDFCASIRADLFRMHAIPETADEVKAIAASLGQGADSYALGPDFTDTGVMRRGDAGGDLARYKILYFTTHGILPQAGCLDSALLTSLGDGSSDALLDVKKIPNLVLDADLVVLSACDTGRGANGDGGEALGGLVSTFVEAGARNVVVSNWAVDASAAKKLMIAMFAEKGVSQADALARAERTMMASPDQFSHPYFWAPFMVVGDGARDMPAI